MKMCDYPKCDAKSVGGYSIGLFAVDYCEGHRDHFEHQRAEYFADQRAKARKAVQRHD